MTVFGILTQKYSAQNPSFNNRYYVNVANMESAMIAGVNIAEYEATIFGNTVQFVNCHTWLPGSDPRQFSNTALNFSGELTAATPIASWITAEVVWGTNNSYPSYKRYRTQVTADEITGLNWVSGYLTELTAFTDLIFGYEGILCTREGVELGPPTVTIRYMPLQVGKAWYNRETP